MQIPGNFTGKAEIFEHQCSGEIRMKIAIQNLGRFVGNLSTAGSALTDNLHKELRINACLTSPTPRLRQRRTT